MCGTSVWCLLFVLLFAAGSKSGDVPSILTNAYAKVAKWGAANSGTLGEGRSSNGQSFFTQRYS